MNFDKNTIIGWICLALLFVAFFWYNTSQQQKLLEAQKIKEDSIARVIAAQKPKNTSILSTNTINNLKANDTFLSQVEQIHSLENDNVKVYFTNLGGQISKILLKKYLFNQQPVVLGHNNQFKYSFYETPQKINQNNILYFNTIFDSVQNKITYSYTTTSGNQIQQVYTLEPNSYKVKFNLIFNAKDDVFLNKDITINWNVESVQQEPGLSYDKQQTNFCFYEGDDFDYFTGEKTYTSEKPLKWISLSQQFFNNTLIFPDNKVASIAQVQFDKPNNDTSTTLASLHTKFSYHFETNPSLNLGFTFMFAPNDLRLLENEPNDIAKIVNYGRGLYAFVRPINVYILDPFFNFIAKYITSFGWCILILTIFIKIITAPLTYSGYVSSAKMKVLKPELDALKAKMGSNQQGFAMEQMKLFREAGVNPLSGCVPALLIIPIFGSLFNFFNANIVIRGEHFLWVKDLSSYDSLFEFGFTIPFYGSHFSLFTFLAAITTFLSSMYNMSATPAAADNPAFKYMPYIFPFVMLFMFNSTPAALNIYYTVANVLTILIQLVIQKYIIDHNKIHAKINEKRKQPKKKSGWQERYEKMLETQKKVESMKNKGKK
ncbi:MAG: YidC/Oxa1 family insertase periplasmic-domain containing protein [Alphaproteobacteria bacterium]|nr:YidC/Oxa1 family insertase periplasmic-domain containing protein [Alphaproteobacteria bacterium]